MNKKEIREIKRQFSPQRCTIVRICGCYADVEKEKRTRFSLPFYKIAGEETFKYFDLFKKTLSGAIGKNLMTLTFQEGSRSEGKMLLSGLKKDGLHDEGMAEEFFEKVLETYDIKENILILLAYGAYDIPGQASDGIIMFDASEEVYEYLMCAVCPVKLSKPGLSYNAEGNCFQNRIQDCIVEAPLTGFLYPAFEGRRADFRKVLYYTRSAEKMHGEFIKDFLHCDPPLTATDQKEVFQELVERTLEEGCDYQTVLAISEKVSELAKAHKNMPETATLSPGAIQRIFAESGAKTESLEKFEETFTAVAGGEAELVADNMTGVKEIEISTPDLVIRVAPDKGQLVRSAVVDGEKCLVIKADKNVQVNGIFVRI